MLRTPCAGIVLPRAPVAQWSTGPFGGPKSVGLSSRRSRVRIPSGAFARCSALCCAVPGAEPDLRLGDERRSGGVLAIPRGSGASVSHPGHIFGRVLGSPGCRRKRPKLARLSAPLRSSTSAIPSRPRRHGAKPSLRLRRKGSRCGRSGRPHPSQRSEGEEEAAPHPRFQLRGNAPLRESGGALRGDGPRLHRHRLEAGGGSAASPQDFDGETLQVRRTAHEGQILEGTKTDHGEPNAGRVVPVPATLAWMLFPTPRGRLWRERTFYRDVWNPTQKGRRFRHSAARVQTQLHHESTSNESRRRRSGRRCWAPHSDDALSLHACSRCELRGHAYSNRLRLSAATKVLERHLGGVALHHDYLRSCSL